jgi:hypothetical protein
VCEATDTGGEYLAWNDEGCGVGTEVHEELGDDDESEAGAGSDVRSSSEDTKHQGCDEEALDLDPLATEDLNQGNRDEIAGNVTCHSDNQVALGVVEEVFVRSFSGGIPNGGEDDGLVQVDAVEGHVD